jgi:hypothetical protein
VNWIAKSAQLPGYDLDESRNQGSIIGRDKRYLLHSFHIGSEAHPASYLVDTGGSSPKSNMARAEADHPSPSGAEVNSALIHKFSLRVA